jgi:hypothetical protein
VWDLAEAWDPESAGVWVQELAGARVRESAGVRVWKMAGAWESARQLARVSVLASNDQKLAEKAAGARERELP